MRGIKPFKLSFITRPFQWGPTHHLGIGVLAYARLGDPEVFTDLEMWMECAELMGDDILLDAGIPKSRSEFLLVGNAYQPDGVPGVTRQVRVKVGEVEKSLYVIGDRFWRRGVPTEPVPFTEMPLVWANSFGGEGYDKNPFGKGAKEPEGEDPWPLPNIEPPGGMVTSPRDKPDPAGFGRIDFTWPQRFSMGGTYDKKWLDTRFPGFAEDMDWRMWNMAAPDQQQEEPWRGDELIECDHVHPTKTRITGRLPGLNARAFVSQAVGEEPPKLIEVGLRLTTVWLLPPIERMVLVYHGAHPVREDDAADVEAIMVAGERVGQPRPMEHYQHVFDKRSGPDRALEILNDADLFPAEWSGMGPEIDEMMATTKPENLAFERQFAVMERENAETRARLEELGLDPDEHGPKKPERPEGLPPLNELGDFIKKKQEEAQKGIEESKAHQAQAQAKAKAFYDEEGLDFDEVEKEMTEGQRGPPTFTADGERMMFRELADEAEEAGHPVEELEWFATDEEPYKRFQVQEEQELDAYRRMAHFQAPAFPLDPADSERRRAVVETAVRSGDSLAGWDLTGADLSGMDLSKVDFEKALLESVNFEGARLDMANLQGAVLAHSNLSAASLERANLNGANLGKAVCRATNFKAADLRDALLVDVDLTAADLSHANMEEMTISNGTFDGTVMRHANMNGVTFQEVGLTRVDLMGAQLAGATFFKVDVSELDLSGAILEEATFFGTRAVQSTFVNAKMAGVRTVEGCSFAGSDLKGADLTSANLRDLDLTGADLSGARLDKADVSGANLTEAKMYRMVARGSLWTRTNLQRAQMVSADLFEAMLEKADLRGTDLRGANLYAANFSLIHSDADTKVTDAIQDKVRILPQREKEKEPVDDEG